MLELTKNITLSGMSKINGQVVVYMTANLSTDGSSSNNVSKNISNRELYDANKTEVRKDMADFDDMVYAQEDELVGGQVDEVK